MISSRKYRKHAPGTHVPRATFERIVRQAIRDLPGEYRQRLGNLAFVVEQRPTISQLRQTGLPTLYGLYVGLPLSHVAAPYSMSPNKIIIFQQPIEERSVDRDHLVEQVRSTVVHEIAHQFGISDARLRAIEAVHPTVLGRNPSFRPRAALSGREAAAEDCDGFLFLLSRAAATVPST